MKKIWQYTARGCSSCCKLSKVKAKPLLNAGKAIPAKPEVDDSPYAKKKLKKGMFTDFGADKFGTTAYEVPTEKNYESP
jgi:hypothetical protein